MAINGDISDAMLFDYLQERFGIGDWDEATSAIPWWQFRGREIAKLKSMRTKRKATTTQLVAAADYAVEQCRPIYATYQLFALIPEAMAARRRQEQAKKKGDLARGINEAFAEAVAAGETEWAERLMRTQVSEAQTVINEWRNR